MLKFLTRFAAENAESGPAVHITPGELFQIGDISVTNSMFYGWLSSALIIILLVTLARRATLRPRGGLIQYLEIFTDFITNLIQSSLGSRKKALKYSPYFATIFIYILLSNWLGLIPGVGETLTYNHNPVFRPFTADINGTLAAAIVIMFFVQYFAIKESGFFNHLKHYFNGSMKNPVTLFLGIFEMFSELTRVASLALRLFLNVTIGEVIIAVFTYLGSGAAPIVALPFVILELLVGALQAYIFVMLSVMYLAVAVKHGAEHEAEESQESVPDITKIKESRG